MVSYKTGLLKEEKILKGSIIIVINASVKFVIKNSFINTEKKCVQTNAK
jgi:hypothetical protein